MDEVAIVAGSRRSWAAGIMVGGLIVLAAVLCAYLGVLRARDWQAFHFVPDGHVRSVWKDLVLRRIREGDDLAETVRKHRPLGREDLEPYTVLRYSESGSQDTLEIVAAEGRLIYAGSTGLFGTRVFFQSPTCGQDVFEDLSRHRTQRLLATEAYKIHCAIAAGQDVFLAQRIRSRLVFDDPNLTPSEQRLLLHIEEVHGRDEAKSLGFGGHARTEWTVEVAKVLHGALKPGITLTFFSEQCGRADLAESQHVFLHVGDSRTILPDSEGGELYLTVPAEALEWYQSLTPEQIKDLDARSQARKPE